MKNINWSKIFSYIIYFISSLIIIIMCLFTTLNNNAYQNGEGKFIIGLPILLLLFISYLFYYFQGLKGYIKLKLDKKTAYYIGDEITGTIILKIKNKDIKDAYLLTRLTGYGLKDKKHLDEYERYNFFTEIYSSEKVIENLRDYPKKYYKQYKFSIKIPNFEDNSKISQIVKAKWSFIEWKVEIDLDSLKSRILRKKVKIKIKFKNK